MLYLYRLILGFVRVIFCGESNEKILNLTAKNKISLWNIKLTKNGIEGSVTIRDFKRLRGLIKNSGVRVHIKEKCGIPFEMNKNRKRLGMFIGVLFFAIFLYIMSGYIWVINVDGNNYVKNEEILSLCREIGIDTGVKKSRINPKQQRQTLLLKSEDLSWVSLNIEGSKLTVNVSEVEKVCKDTNAYNIKASKDGIIKKIDVTSGSCVVKINDVVKKGDLLVSGVVEESGTTKFVNAEGSIYAETINEINQKENFKRNIETPNGKIKRKYVLQMFSLKLPMYLGTTKGMYHTKTDKMQLNFFNTNLPVCLYEKKFVFYNQSQITSSEEELKKILKERVVKQIKKEKYKECEKISEEFSITEKGVELKYKFKAQENIASKEEMLIADK